eukprot:TRINITY_DN1964_c0_g1_i1.p1 TRINITY_DN1964_c0_g1~~TRINITY_DN1964_c0_g1_i1.p1  ORF type:complete len:1106 (-),score=300.09 TRINITY_DN1964_c0_g1_i1:113-3430(-)
MEMEVVVDPGRPSIEIPLVNNENQRPRMSYVTEEMRSAGSRDDMLAISSEFHIKSTTLSMHIPSSAAPKLAASTSEPGVTSVDFYEPPKASVKLEAHSVELDKQTAEDLKVDYHTITPQSLASRYKTDLNAGLSEDEAKRRLSVHGPNSLVVENKFLQVKKIIGHLFSGFGVILWPASLLCFIAWRPLGSPPDPSNLGLAIVLLVVIATQALFNAYQDWKSNKVMSSITNMMPQNTYVLRDGQIQNVAVSTITIGDVVRLTSGIRAPADLRLVQVQDLKVDNSILTGEAEPISATVNATDRNFMESKNMVFMGSSIIEGTAVGVVVAISNDTVMGKIARLTNSSEGADTPLKKEITRFVIIIVSLVVATSIIIAVSWAFWLRPTYPDFLTLSNLIVTIIGAVVAFLPDGLPVCVTMALTIMAKRMHDNQVLAKSLPTVETLGMVDIIASDKTGTLTQNKMAVSHVLALGSSETELEPFAFRQALDDDVLLQTLVRTCALCNRAVFDPSTMKLPLNERKVIGDASDTAMLLFCEDMGLKADSIRGRYQKLAEIPFNSRNKWSLAIYRQPSSNKKPLLVMKGAAEIMLNRASSLMMKNGELAELTDDIRQQIIVRQENLCNQGERVLGLCQLELNDKIFNADTYKFIPEELNFPTDGLTFLGLVSLIDPPRDDVAAAVEAIQEAGIRVMMVTGDHHGTAAAIARRVGIITSQKQVLVTQTSDMVVPFDRKEETPRRKKKHRSMIPSITNQALVIRGVDMQNFTEETWDLVFEHKEIVFARTTPEDKLLIVRECQSRGHTVAVTGDGVNDAPALKQAQVGVAMGGGSEVAREAADLVLLNNQFSSIVAGIQCGRLAFQNLKKVILYLLPAGSFSELLPILANVFLGLPLPLSPFLMIVICVGTDVFPALAIVNETAESDLMKQPPRGVTGERLVNFQLYGQGYCFLGIIESLAGFTMFFWYMSAYGGFGISDLFFLYDKYTDGYGGKTQDQLNDLLWTAQTIFFVALVSVQLGNLMCTRTRTLSFFQHNPLAEKTKNSSLLSAIGITLTIAIFVVYIPIFQNVFNTRPIPVQYWFVPYCFSLLLFGLDELRKYLFRKVPLETRRRYAW